MTTSRKARRGTIQKLICQWSRTQASCRAKRAPDVHQAPMIALLGQAVQDVAGSHQRNEPDADQNERQGYLPNA